MRDRAGGNDRARRRAARATRRRGLRPFRRRRPRRCRSSRRCPVLGLGGRDGPERALRRLRRQDTDAVESGMPVVPQGLDDPERVGVLADDADDGLHGVLLLGGVPTRDWSKGSATPAGMAVARFTVMTRGRAMAPDDDRRGLPRRRRPGRRSPAAARQARPPLPDARVIRGVVAALALLLGAYCLLAAATVLYAQTPPGNPNPAELAARERVSVAGLDPGRLPGARRALRGRHRGSPTGSSAPGGRSVHPGSRRSPHPSAAGAATPRRADDSLARRPAGASRPGRRPRAPSASATARARRRTPGP